MMAGVTANPSRGAFRTCLEVFQATPIERIGVIRAGVGARWVEAVLGDFMRDCASDLSALKLSKAGVARGSAQDAHLSQEASERLVGIAGLIGQVETMVGQSGAPEGFNASHWFAEWVISPVPALGGVRPIECLDTWEGRATVSNLLAQMQSSAYA
jgi:uncharacterized protein (DUF2384 family)